MSRAGGLFAKISGLPGGSPRKLLGKAGTRVRFWELSGVLVTLCRVNYEGMTMETTVKANAGSTVAFNETLSFLKQKDRHIMKVLSPRHRYANP